MKNKGFTLIELLAVIVILAIIALIATPIVLNVIDAAKEETNKRSVEMYAKAVKNAIAQYQLVENKMPLTYDDIDEYLKYDGPKITVEEFEIYEDGSIFLDGIKIKDENLELSYGKRKGYKNGDIVFIDITTGSGCTNYHTDNSKTGYNGINRTGNQTSCLKFYAFLDDGSDKISLLLDHNTTAVKAWKTSTLESNVGGPQDVLNQLIVDTSGWNVPDISENYNYRGTDRPYTIDYINKNAKARLITAQEIAKITTAENKLNWKEENSMAWYKLDGAKGPFSNWQGQVANSTNKSEFYWLFDRISRCLEYGCLNESDTTTYGYWTSSAHSGSASYAWGIIFGGEITSNEVDEATYFGVRPVINILKSSIQV